MTETNLNVSEEKSKDMSVVSEKIESLDEDDKTKSEDELILENLQELSFKDAGNEFFNIVHLRHRYRNM